MKLITFAVPCYNSAAYMEKCINSLLKADNEEIEIVIVNDGSTKDNTAEIADCYAAEYPSVIKAVHQENGGHGEAVNTGLKNATGKYFKVVDSDDWVDETALKKVMSAIRSFEGEGADAVVVNYVYEHTADGTTKVVDYKRILPENREFSFEETKKFPTGTFFAMHSLIYKTEVLKNCGLVLPKHTFYVDNIFVYTPLPFVKTFYYVNADFYRYFIGRDDQSVNEKVLMSRIDQHILVTEILIKTYDLNKIKEKSPKLYRYMSSFVHIMMTITSIYLIKIGDEASFAKKDKLWQLLKSSDEKLYKSCRRSFTGLVASNDKLVNSFCKTVYTIVRKIFKFN